MRPKAKILYQRGYYEGKYQRKIQNGDLDDDFSIYDTFHDTAIHEKGYLKRLAVLKGYIDALTYVSNNTTEHIPLDCDWIRPTPERTLHRVEVTYSDACHGGEGTTWMSYLRGWRTALRFALDDKERPWGSQVYLQPS